MEVEIVDAEDKTGARFFGRVLSVGIGVDDSSRGFTTFSSNWQLPAPLRPLGLTQLCQRNHNAHSVHWPECAHVGHLSWSLPNMLAFCGNLRSRELISWSVDAIVWVFVSCWSGIFHYQVKSSQPIIMSPVWSRVTDIWHADECNRGLFYLLFLHFPKFK